MQKVELNIGSAYSPPILGVHQRIGRAYPTILIALHWLTALCMIVLLVCAALHALGIGGKATRSELLNLHRMAGTIILLLTGLRIFARVLRRHTIPPVASDWKGVVASAVHGALYFGLVAIPVLGWMLTNAIGKDVSVINVWVLPRLTGRDLDFADQIQQWHIALGWLLAAMVALHIAAALWHRYIVRDDIWGAMLPQRDKNS